MTGDPVDTNSLDEEVSRRYPYLLAATFYRAFHSTRDLDEAHEYLLDLFEVTLKYLTSIALSQYFKDAPNDPKINRDVRALRRPSLGHWQGWLRDILDLYERSGRPLAVPELASFYRHKHTGELLRAYTTLRDVMSRMGYGGGKSLGVITPKQFFELVGDYRNLLAHGVRPGRPDRERVAAILAPAMRDIFASMSFVADYRLVYVDEVKRAPGSAKQGRRYEYYYTTLMGDRPRAAPSPRTLDRDDTEPEKLYLLAKEQQFEPLISLYPFLTFRYCDSCNAYQAFVLNTSKGDTLDYVSYQCTHHYAQAEFLYLQELLNSVGADAGGVNIEEPLPDEEQLAKIDTQEQSAQQAHEERERQLREAAERQAKEDAARREEEQRQEQLRLEQERLVLAQAQRQREEQEHRTREETQRRVREEQIARENTERQAAQVVEQVPAPSTPYYVAPPVTRKSGRTILWVSIASILLLSGISAAVVLSMRPDRRDSAQATATAKALAARTETAVALGTATPLAQVSATTGVQSGLLDTLTGHTDGVTSVAFSPDGKQIASGSYNNTIKLWKVDDGTEIRTFTGHTDQVYSVAFSPDGKQIASGSTDKTIKLWRVDDGAEIRTFTGHTDVLRSVAFSPDGKQLASGSYDNTAKLWQVDDGTEIRTFTGHTDNVISVAFSPDGKQLASGSYDETIKLWRVDDGTEIRTFTGHADYVLSVAFSPDGTLLASGSTDMTTRLWRVNSGIEIRTLTGHQDLVRSVAFSPDGKLLASGSYDATIKLWRVDGGTEIHALTGHENIVLSVAFSPDGTLLASGSNDRTIKLWKVP